MKVKLAHKVIAAIALPVLIQICFLGMLLKSVEQLDRLEKVEHATADILVIRNQISITEALVFLYYALFRVSGKQEYKSKLTDIQKMHEKAFQSLNRVWKNDKVKQHILVNQWQIALFRMLAFKFTLNFPPATKMEDFFGGAANNHGEGLLAYNRGNLDRLFDEFERSQARMLLESQQKETDIKHEMLAALIASLVVTLGAGLMFSRSIAMRLRKVVSNIKAMEKPEREQELIVIDGNDEIAALNNAVIDTNKKIKEAEQFQAQTAGIVADELEKPLTQINDYFVTMKNSGFDELSDSGHERIERSLLDVCRDEKARIIG